METNNDRNCSPILNTFLDIERSSKYSSKEGSIQYNSVIIDKIKSEILDDFIKEDNEKNEISFLENCTSFKAEKIIQFNSNNDSGLSDAKKRQIFKCYQCPKMFSNSSAIAKHKLTHSDERKYVCEICSKAFKRQDHLNGHKHTHKINKPHACHLCDRSYSDARSLRRHYENQHQDEFLRCKDHISGRDSAASSLDESASVEVFGLLDEAKCIKCDVCAKGFRNQSALNGHMRLHGGYGSSSNSITGPGEARNSTLDVGHLMPSRSPPSQLHMLLENTHSTSTKDVSFQNDCIDGQNRTLHSDISSSLIDEKKFSSIGKGDMCPCLPQPPRSTVDLSTGPISETCDSSLNNDMDDSQRMETHYSPITPAFTSSAVTFTYPTLIDLPSVDNNLHEYHHNLLDNEKPCSFYDGQERKIPELTALPHISSSSNIQDLIINLESIDNNCNLETEWNKLYEEGNEDVNHFAESSETESFMKKEPVKVAIVNSPCINSHGNTENKPQEQTIANSRKKNKTRPAPIFIPPQTSAHWSRLRSPRVWSTSDGNEVNIPPYTPPPMLSPQRKGSGLFNSVWQCNNKNSGHLSSSSYQCTNFSSTNSVTVVSNDGGIKDKVVPSTSLGPHQISSVMNHSPTEKAEPCVQNEIVNQITIIKKNGEPEHFLYHDDCIQCHPHTSEEADGLPTSATPRINLGPQYQADLPKYSNKCFGKRKLHDDKRLWDELLWDPTQYKDTPENNSSLDLLMKVASSPAVKSCGLNMEYTFHLLCKFKGDLEKTLRTLLEDSFVVYDYVYAETTIWTTEEIINFQERLKKRDRDFMRVAYDLQSMGMNKSVKACVEFYYVWKQMNSIKDINRFRTKTIPKKRVAVINDSFGATSAETLSSREPAYNLRQKHPKRNHKVYLPYNSFEYKTSSEGTSREASPKYCKSRKNNSTTNVVRVNRFRPYHCSFCKRKFAKSKTLENHLKRHRNSNSICHTLPFL